MFRKFRHLALVAALALANVALVAVSQAEAEVTSLDYACEEFTVGACRCTDEFPLNECQLSGGSQACADLYPQVCRNVDM